MTDLTAYTGNTFLRWLTGQAVMPSSPAGLYLALFDGDPKAAGTEVGASVNSLGARQAITFAALAAGTGHLITSNNAQDWGNSENDVSISHVGLMDAASSGNMIASRAVVGGPISVLTGSLVKFASGATTFNVGS